MNKTALALVVFLSAVSAAFAQSPPETLWKVTCVAAGCEIEHALVRNDVKISRVLVSKVGKADVLEYLVPLGIDIQKGIFLEIDGKATFPTRISYCSPSGCVGFAALDPALRDALQKGKNLKLAFVPRGKGFYAFDYPLTGFIKSYDAFSNSVAAASN